MYNLRILKNSDVACTSKFGVRDVYPVMDSFQRILLFETTSSLVISNNEHLCI